MHVSEIMTPDAQCVRPDDDVIQAATLMRELNVGCLPVCGPNDRLEGVLTDRDVVVRAVAEDRDLHATNVRDVMTPKIVYCYEDQEAEEAARLMEDHQIRRLAVLSRDKRLVGMLSLGDLAVKAHDDQLSGATLEHVSEPAIPHR